MNIRNAASPLTSAATLPSVIAVNTGLVTAVNSGSSNTPAPAIAITPSRNENSAAANGATPNASATATVEPLREIPGRIAIAWAQPMISAAAQVG